MKYDIDGQSIAPAADGFGVDFLAAVAVARSRSSH